MVIKRYIKDFDRLKNDFSFLPHIIKSLHGEIELSLRENYFNLYYRGNSIAKVGFKPDGKYEVIIHNEFYQKTSAAGRFKKYIKPVKDKNYVHLLVEKDSLHPLFQRKHLVEFCSKVKKRNFSEELTLEQMIISDNSTRDDLIIIDRQVTDTKMKGRMDLLALKQLQGNRYKFLVLEAKMGNNPELAGSVADQLEGYVSHIDKHFADYKACYEENYRQKKEFGLINHPDFQTIEIVPGVEGMVVVSGYSGLARSKIKELRKKHPSIRIKQFHYGLDVENKGLSGANTILFGSNNMELAKVLIEWCKDNQKVLFFAQLNTPDLIAIPSFIIIVDRNYISNSAWEDYCAYCNEISQPLPDDIPDEIKEDLASLPDFDDTPVIIIDDEKFSGIHGKNKGNIYSIDQSNYSEIIKTLDSIVYDN